jgi:hypothetical protein
VGIGIFRTVSQSFANDPDEPFRDVAIAAGLYGSVVFGHLVCIWNAANVLRYETLNRARLVKEASAFRDGGAESVSHFEKAGEEEGVYKRRFQPGDPILGASLPDAARDWAHLETLVKHGVVRIDGSEGPSGGRRFALGWNSEGKCPAVLLDPAASPRDVIAAALAGVHASKEMGDGDDAEGYERAYAFGDANVDEFERAMSRKGWRTDFVQLGSAPRYRLSSLVSSGRREGGGDGRGSGGVGVDASVDDILTT